MEQLPPDIDQQVRHYLSTGHYQTEEDVLRDALRALGEENCVLADIRQGLQDLEANRGRPLDEVDAELRKKYNIQHEV
jgi:Arc/MetJ-type ribon-helix-helix transcriptional regulator